MVQCGGDIHDKKQGRKKILQQGGKKLEKIVIINPKNKKEWEGSEKAANEEKGKKNMEKCLV